MQLGQKITANLEVSEQTFKGVGGLAIFTRSWRPVTQPAWRRRHCARVQLSQRSVRLGGRTIGGGRLRGLRDRPPWTRQIRRRAIHVDKFGDYVDDLATFIQRAKVCEPSLPVFLFGHSAGGVIASLYAVGHQSGLAGLISESFAFELPAPAFALSALKGISYLAPHLRVLKLKNEDFSRDPEVVQSMNRDPLIANENQTAKTVAELIRADERLRTKFPGVTLPLLILHGTMDKAAKPSGSQFFYDTAGSRDKTLRLYDGAYHDPLNDVGRETVAADLVSWVEAHLPKGSDAKEA